MIRLLFAFTLLLSFGCASKTSQIIQENSFNDEHFVKGVPFVSGEEKFCGPASLAILLEFENVDYQYDEVVEMLFSPKSGGTFQNDMIAAARRLGLLTYMVSDLSFVLKEVGDNRPVIVFKNLGLSIAPQWHYSVLKGYSRDGYFIFNSGIHEDEHIRFKTFERMWARADNWGLIVFKPGEIPKTANELDVLKATADLENLNQLESAKISYYAIESRWENSLGALIGLGNVYYLQEDFKKSYKYLQKAVENHPQSEIAKNNLKVVRESL